MRSRDRLRLRRVIFTGGPGAGKTTLLRALASMGYSTVEESARAVIAERVAAGLGPRPEPAQFAREVLRRDIEKYASAVDRTDWVFFDRTVVESMGALHEHEPVPASELKAMLATCIFHQPVFILPPWVEIYTTDPERDQSFEDAVDVHRRIVRWYSDCGYSMHQVPCIPVEQRAAYVLRVLGAWGA